jgi:hypothetical protein
MNIQRLLKFAIYFLSLSIVTFFIVYFALVFFLRKNGISFTEKNFDLPSTLTIKGLHINQSNLSANVEDVEVNLSWKSIFKGQLQGDYLIVRNANIQQTTDTSTQQTDFQAFPGSLPIHFQKLILSNIDFKLINTPDTLLLTFPELIASNVNLIESYHIDSLLIRGSILTYNQQAVTIPSVNDTTRIQSESTLAAIPQFSINSLSFVGGNINYNTPEQKQVIRNFNIELTGLKDNDLLAASVSLLSFRYQDTLDVSLNLGKFTINNQEETKIQQLNLNLPWLRLQIPQLELSNLHSPQVHALIQKSYVNTALVRFFFPTIELPVSNDLNLNFDGGVSYSDSRIGFEQLGLQLENIARMNLDGYADLPDKPDASIQLNINQIESSYRDISRLFDLPKAAHQKEIKMTSGMKLSGNYSHLKAEGTLSMNNIVSDFVAALEQNDNKKMNLTASLRSKFIDPSLLFDSLGGSIKLYNLLLSGQLAMNNQSLSGFSLKLLSDSVFYDDQHISKPDIEIRYDQSMTSATIHISEMLNASLHSTDNVLSDHFSFMGSIESYVPQLIDFKQNAGDFYTSFKGQFDNSKNSLHFKLALDTLRFAPASLPDVYQTNGIITAGQNEEGTLHLDLSLDNQEYIHFLSSGDILDWWDRADKWQGNFPTAAVDLSISVDSVLVKQFTSLNASVRLNNLKIRSENDGIKASIDLPSFVFIDFAVKDMRANIEFTPEMLESQLTIASFQNPYANLESTKINIVQKGTKKVGLSVESYIPEIRNNIELNTELAYTDTSYIIGLEDNKNLRLGKLDWQNQKSKGFVFNRDFDFIAGELSISNNQQKIRFETSKNVMSFNVDSLDLSPLGQLFSNDTTFRALLNTSGNYHLNEKSLNWLVSISDIITNNIQLGEVRLDGFYSDSLLKAHLEIDEGYGKVDASILKEGDPFEYHLDISELDVNFLNSGLSPWSETMPLSGRINAKLNGTYDTIMKSTGYVGFSNLQTYLTDYKIYLNIQQDTLWFHDNNLIAKSFKISDQKGDVLALDGSLSLQEDLLLDVSVKSKKFIVLDNNSGSSDLKGKVDIATDLHILHNQNQFSINGDVSMLPNSSLRYVYQSSVSIDEREKEITFVSFDSLDHPEARKRQHFMQTKRSNPIQWDVNLAVGKSDVTIILSETAQDQIKMTTDGSFLLKTGDSDQPFFFGILQSKEGSIIYDAPAVSDLNFTIENLEVVWNGELADPKVTFLGSEIFRVTPKGIPGMTNSNTVVPITVLAKVDDRPINDFTLSFDMNSNNAQVKSWIQSLPPDTREATAINLLLFGSLNFGETGGSSSLLQNLVGKMNEISRRNIKSADISFYVDNENMSESSVNTKEKLGYSLSKNLFDKRVKISVGGSVDLSNSSEPGQKGPVALGNVQLDYIVSNSPEISLMLAQKSTYDGVINGQINESSAGITFQKSFRNFFKTFKKKKPE